MNANFGIFILTELEVSDSLSSFLGWDFACDKWKMKQSF